MVSSGSPMIVVFIVIAVVIGLMYFFMKIWESQKSTDESEENKEKRNLKDDFVEQKEFNLDIIDEETEKKLEQTEMTIEQKLYIFLQKLLQNLSFLKPYAHARAYTQQVDTYCNQLLPFTSYAHKMANRLLTAEVRERNLETKEDKQNKDILKKVLSGEKRTAQEDKQLEHEMKKEGKAKFLVKSALVRLFTTEEKNQLSQVKSEEQLEKRVELIQKKLKTEEEAKLKETKNEEKIVNKIIKNLNLMDQSLIAKNVDKAYNLCLDSVRNITMLNNWEKTKLNQTQLVEWDIRNAQQVAAMKRNITTRIMGGIKQRISQRKGQKAPKVPAAMKIGI